MPENLIIIEHDGHSFKPSSLKGISLARVLGGDFGLAVLGGNAGGVAESLRSYGAALIMLADDPLLAEPLADRYASVIAGMAQQLDARTVIGASSTFAKDILPRVAALLDFGMVSDVTSVMVKNGETLFERPVNAGTIFATVRLDGHGRVLTVRTTAFSAPVPADVLSPVKQYQVDPAILPRGTRFVSRRQPESPRPDLSEARIVVSGGRPLKDLETFERLIGGLADALGGAVAATRAAVDAGLAPNDCQVGQTGKVVAPDLYVAVGVSGAIQHLAGISDSKIIVAINRDPEAPVFEMATYGLVGDLNVVVPELISALRG